MQECFTRLLAVDSTKAMASGQMGIEGTYSERLTLYRLKTLKEGKAYKLKRKITIN